MKMKNLYRIIFINIIVILILLIVIICIYGKQISEQEQGISYPPAYSSIPIETVEEDIIIPENSIEFFKKYKYTRVQSKEIYEAINYLAKNTIPKYIKETSKLSEEELKKYYDNKNNLENDLIESNSFENFKKIITQAGKYDSELVVKKIKFDSDNIEQKDNYICAGIDFEFNNYVTYSFKIKVYNNESESGKFIYFYVE